MKGKTCCGTQSIVLSTVTNVLQYMLTVIQQQLAHENVVFIKAICLFVSASDRTHTAKSNQFLLVKLHLRSVFTGSARFIILHCTRATRQLMVCAVNTDFCIMPNKAAIVDGMVLVPICYVFITFHSFFSWVLQRSILQCVTIGWLRPGCRVHPARLLFAILQRLCFW